MNGQKNIGGKKTVKFDTLAKLFPAMRSRPVNWQRYYWTTYWR